MSPYLVSVALILAGLTVGSPAATAAQTAEGVDVVVPDAPGAIPDFFDEGADRALRQRRGWIPATVGSFLAVGGAVQLAVGAQLHLGTCCGSPGDGGPNDPLGDAGLAGAILAIPQLVVGLVLTFVGLATIDIGHRADRDRRAFSRTRER